MILGSDDIFLDYWCSVLEMFRRVCWGRLTSRSVDVFLSCCGVGNGERAVCSVVLVKLLTIAWEYELLK